MNKERKFITITSWSTCNFPGGDSTWREFLTLPNILKEYNPNLRGYSTGTGEWLAKNSRLNVAFPVASDQDAYKQAKVSTTQASPCHLICGTDSIFTIAIA